MSDQPPPYEEAVAGNPAPPGPPSALVVHLQVWHYRSEGRSPANNDGLAALFRNHNLQNWEVVPLEVGGITGLSCHDQYVPVEVRFRHRIWAYNDPGEHPMADVRELFFKIAPQFIYEFFIRIRSAPHNLNIFPVGVPEEFNARYTHAYVLNRLSIRVTAFFVPGPVMTNDVQSWLREAVNTVANVLDILADIVCLYLLYRQAQHQGNGNGQAGIQYETQFAHVSNVNWPPHLRELQTLLQQFMQPNDHGTAQSGDRIADVQVALDGAARPLQQYLRLANRMESRLMKLGEDQPLSNQDLYELVQDAHNAALHFSTLKQAVQPLARLLEEHYTAQNERYRTNRSQCVAIGTVTVGALAAVAIFCWWNPAGWLAVGAYGAGFAAGGVVGAGAHSKADAERGKALSRKDAVREFGRAVRALDMCTNQAQEAIAKVFCAQVMQKQLDDALPEHDVRILLATLGVDVDAASNSVYREELIRDRLKRFCENIRKLRTQMKRVVGDANFEFHTTEHDA